MKNLAIIPMKDQWAYTRDLVAQLDEQGETDGIAILDNGSTQQGSQSFLWDLERRHTVFRCPTMNIHQMWNLGCSWARLQDYDLPNVAILNNDIRIGPHFMSRLAEGLRADERIWAVCPHYDGREMAGRLVQIHDIAAGKMDGTGGYSSFAFMVRGELFGDPLPWFDENLQWFFGDNDFYENVQARGGVIAMVRGVGVEHLNGGSNTVHARLDVMRPAFQADKAYFEQKWQKVALPAT